MLTATVFRKWCAVFISLVLLCFSWAPAIANAQDSDELAATIDRMLEHVGGRDVWARATGFHTKTIERVGQQRLPVSVYYWRDFEKLHGAMLARNQDIRMFRLYDADRGRIRRMGEEQPMTSSDLKREHNGWRANIYLIFSQLARRDPSVSVSKHHEKLIFKDQTGEAYFWIALDRDGRPVQYGRGLASDYGASHILRNYETLGDVTLWTVTEPMHGDGRYEILEFELLTNAQDYGFNTDAFID